MRRRAPQEITDVFARVDASRIYLIRHGRPRSGWGGFDDDPGLDDHGVAQAHGACMRLMDLPAALRPRVVVSSPLRRCMETAAPLAEALGREIIIDPAVGEIPTPTSLAREERSAWLRSALQGAWGAIPGDEDYGVWRRSVADAVASHGGAAIFSHFVAINAVTSLLSGDDQVVVFRPDYASTTVLEVRAGALALLQLGAEAATGIL
jgi:broad specificity phosphatase PhoE